MNKVKHIERITNKELQDLTPLTASWHNDYADSAYVFLGGLNFLMNEGDLVTVCSQFGEVVDCRLARDKKTGKFKGFGWLAFEDQRSTVLAVDNLNGTELCGRTICCDHVKQYKIPREYMYLSDDEKDKKTEKNDKKDEKSEKKPQDVSDHSSSEDSEEKEAKAKEKWEKKLYKPTGPDGQGWGDFRLMNDQEQVILEELLKIEKADQKRREKLIMLDAMKEQKIGQQREE